MMSAQWDALDRVTAQRDDYMADLAAKIDELDMLRLSLRNTAARLEHATAVQDAALERANALADLVDRKRETARSLWESLRLLTAERSVAEARLRAVRALHVGVEIEDFPICKECDVYWPCSTWHALDGPGQEERRS